MIGKKLKELRSLKNMTQRELSKELNISCGAIALWEVDKRSPDNKMLIKIADYFKVSTDFLLGKENSETEYVSALSKTNCKDSVIIIGRNGSLRRFNLTEKNLKILEMMAETLEDNKKNNLDDFGGEKQ